MKKWEPNISNVHWAFFDDEGSTIGKVTPDGGGYPTLIIDFEDNTRAEIGWEQKLIRNGINAVFLGIDFEDKIEFTLRPSETNSQSEDLVLKGVTDNEEIVQLTKEFLAALEEQTFRPQTFLEDPSTMADQIDDV